MNATEEYNMYVESFKSSTISPTNTVQEILDKMCYYKENIVIFDYKIFKLIGSKATYDAIFQHFENIIMQILLNYPNVNVHACMKSMSISELDKHKDFISSVCKIFNTKYANVLNKCFIYQAPSVFTQIYSVISIFLHKETREKITVLKK